ncbi:MAG: hypothetical protein COU90_03530 [Candidatus Ryanbacteria bacterium CG10_big_fil_rev_8_21_14_0_10_43_42]|uniref:Uncharacterized protein n=1 Tax=Candidatus Ryanbacteria bacterium CG10_big_fil_rev_8_21_14_0_10_43_42 TaxID=1974864 RepID=A0A2M8KWI1_9BACT|nr:MAG: hypothetical protein COU90_03530 [Candidatus Ryanbacteria bacterium CG10_big_fil_rev_8_21_14_0_10_43_42]
MHISTEAIHRILGFGHEVPLEPEEMARELVVTFFPQDGEIISPRVQKFTECLETAFHNLDVQIVPYEDTLVDVPRSLLLKRFFYAFFNNLKLLAPVIFDAEETRRHLTLKMLLQVKNGKKIKEGITVIVVGERKTGNLAMDNMISFARSQVITIVDMPEHISEQSTFREHFDTAFQLFAHHMTNIVLGVGDKKWLLYNFNASHPIYPFGENFEEIILNSLIPKIAAPLRPPKLKQFIVREHTFSIADKTHKRYVEDIVEGGSILDRTGLWPAGKSVNDLAFRTEFYQWIGGVHLDHRTGMSFGFLARQMALSLPTIYTKKEAREKFGNAFPKTKDYFTVDDIFHVVVATPNESFVVPVPNVYLVTQRSGANKMHMNPAEDTVKIGLEQGKMIIETPENVILRNDYKPSYDTYVMLAHAVGAAIFGAVLKRTCPDSIFVKMLEEDGMALSHWHGYINDAYLPEGWHVYGADNPPVSCSSFQSAIYAFQGKEKAFHHSMESNTEYKGDIHIEPQHGTNITFRTLKELGEFLTSNQDISALGNKYLKSPYETSSQ